MAKINLLPQKEPDVPRISPVKFGLIIALEVAIVGASALYAFRYFSTKRVEERSIGWKLRSRQFGLIEIVDKVRARRRISGNS